jgi:hypothetical protein
MGIPPSDTRIITGCPSDIEPVRELAGSVVCEPPPLDYTGWRPVGPTRGIVHEEIKDEGEGTCDSRT